MGVFAMKVNFDWLAEFVFLGVFCFFEGGVLKTKFKGSWAIWISKHGISILQWYLEIGGINEDDNDLIRIIILSCSTSILIIFEFLPSVMFHTRFKRKCQVMRYNCVLGEGLAFQGRSHPAPPIPILHTSPPPLPPTARLAWDRGYCRLNSNAFLRWRQEMVKRGVTIQLNAEAEGSQRTQQRVDHSLSYTMKKKKKDLINAECHHSIITQKNCGSNRPKGVNLAF